MLELLTTNEVAQILRVSPSTVSRWRMTGNGPTFAKMGRHVRYERSDVEEWIKQSKKDCIYE